MYRKWWIRGSIAILAVLLVGFTLQVLTNHESAPSTSGAPTPQPGGRDRGDPKKPTCESSLQNMVDRAHAGAVVEARGGCVYRETVVIDKPLTLRGGTGAEIRGSDVWDGWMKSGSYWVRGTLPRFHAHGTCEEGPQRCLWPEQVYFDGAPLEQVALEPDSGQFAVDPRRNILLADDPAGHTVEVTTRTHWVVGESGGVTVENFAMRHAANDSQGHGALNNGGYSDWTVRDNALSDTHGAVVSMGDGTDIELLHNEISRGGQLGVHSSRAELALKANDIRNNNTEAFSGGWEAGGVKTSAMDSLVAENNTVHDNEGPGMWCDGGCQNVTYSENRIHHNRSAGILLEISSRARISSNVLWENGWGYTAWGWGGGIVSSSSRDVEIYDNVLAWNADGVSVISAAREGHDLVTDVDVLRNTILAQDQPDTKDNFAVLWGQDFDAGVLFDEGSGNRGEDNRYWYPSPEGTYARFKWNGEPIRTLERFNETPGEEDGRYLSDAAKTKVVSSAGIPPQPEPRR